MLTLTSDLVTFPVALEFRFVTLGYTPIVIFVEFKGVPKLTESIGVTSQVHVSFLVV